MEMHVPLLFFGIGINLGAAGVDVDIVIHVVVIRLPHAVVICVCSLYVRVPASNVFILVSTGFLFLLFFHCQFRTLLRFCLSFRVFAEFGRFARHTEA